MRQHFNVSLEGGRGGINVFIYNLLIIFPHIRVKEKNNMLCIRIVQTAYIVFFPLF